MKNKIRDYTFELYIENVDEGQRDNMLELLQSICRITGYNSSVRIREDWE